ncbi:MAG TPA: enoyl-CoA hydratase/isomerase family protein [Caulobacteraceae bacterium]|nr:enoyl-CoA hydratase/isomerase family protein [Caulobacteraceae bacterium]
MSHLRHRIDGDLSIITLVNPPQNRITSEMTDAFGEAVAKTAASGARALLLHAEGPDFSYGGDIRPWPGLGAPALRQILAGHLAAFNAFESLQIPTVAAVQGLCFGGGLELAVRADIVFAGETARFGHPEQSIGIVTLLGGVYRVAAKVGRAKAYEWALTSEQVPAAEMERRGLINRVVADETLLEEATAFARRLAAGPTLAHAAHKALLRAWTAGGAAAADEVLLDLAMPPFASDDVKMAIPAAIAALDAGKPRPVFDFKGR